MNTWEYKVAYYDSGKQHLESILKEHGRDCWELVTIMPDRHDRYLNALVFKRPNFDNA